ncbi:MAG: hypothetical protein OHK0046_24240 [Anaerolineae bacterium]
MSQNSQNDQAQNDQDPKEIRKIAHEIADSLNETDKKPRRQIMKIVELMGPEFAQQILKESLEIEANGGMMIASGERRRTPGGVFFYIAREKMPEEARMEVFYAWYAHAARRAEREAKYEPFDYTQRAELLARILNENRGEIAELKVTLSGRPTEIERRQHLVVMAMDYHIPETFALPSGVPSPSREPVTYTVYVSARQWEPVEEALQKGDDELMLDGVFGIDPETNTIAIYTTYVTTKKLYKRQQQKKQQQETNKKGGDKADKKGQQPKKGGQPQGNQPQPAGKKQAKGLDSAPVAAAQVVQEEAEVAEVVLNLPDDLPDDVAKKLISLHKAAASFRQKINSLEGKPAGQQFGLEMTLKLLKNTERQIEQLEKQYLK